MPCRTDHCGDYPAQSRGLTVHYAHKVASLSRKTHWTLRFADGKEATHASVVLANGHHINQFVQTETLPVYPVGGQVSHIPTASALSQLRQVLCYDGYLTPQNPSNAHHCIVPVTIAVKQTRITARRISSRTASA